MSWKGLKSVRIIKHLGNSSIFRLEDTEDICYVDPKDKIGMTIYFSPVNTLGEPAGKWV